MMRGIVFKDPNTLEKYHSGRDWDLVMSSKVIGTPPLKMKTITLPDRDGDLDYTDALRGVPSYGTRKLEFVFEWLESIHNWTYVFTTIRNFLHGKRLIVIEPDDDQYYYMGRCEVSDPEGGVVKKFKVTVHADTWRYKNGGDTVVEKTVSSGDHISLSCDWRPVVPTIVTDKTITIKVGGVSYTLTGSGTFKIPKLILKHGVNDIEVTSASNAKVKFTYTEGAI